MINSLESKIRTIPDFPKPGIQYKDITTLLGDANALALLNKHLIERYQNYQLDYVVGIESRGFIFGGALALGLGIGFVPIRKAGKLPYQVYRQEYSLEYGTGILEMHQDALPPNSRVLVIDDVLATGGTLSAAIALVEKAETQCVETCCIIELIDLGGNKKISAPHYSVITCR